jgi:NAD+ diphosphatase
MTSFYAGNPPLNRLSWLRPSAETLNGHLHDEKARFIAFKYVPTGVCIYQADQSRDFKPLVKKSSPGELHFLSFKDVESRVGPDWGAP